MSAYSPWVSEVLCDCQMPQEHPTSEVASAKSPGTRLAAFLLAVYKVYLSPVLPSSCRFYPTCSDYAKEAIERHGVLRGSSLTLRRLLRCQPFSQGGYDPVPDA